MVNTKLKRSKYFSFLISIIVLLNLTSCEGFFADNDLDQKIRAAIDYANAPSSSFWIAADATAGTINPIGKISYKPTDYQNIKFKLKPEYQFIRWNFRYEEVQSSEKYQKEITDQNWWKDYIEIVNEEISEPSSNGEITYSLQIKFIKSEENMLIEPICAKKPAIKNFVGEGLGLSGMSREKELWFSFNSNIKNSIFYSQDEINSITDKTKVLQSESGIYGYETVEGGETKTHFKNINITLGSAKANVNSFYKLIYNESDFTLYLSPLDILDFVSATENISINFSSNIQNSDYANMDETSRVITLNKVTDKAGIISVKLSSNAQDSYQSYSVGERIEQTFTEDEITQFVKWQVTAENQSSLSKLGYETNENSIVFWVKDEIKQAERVVVTAISAPRPGIKAFIPSSPNAAEARDTDIEIQFDKPINLQSFIDGYKILFNGIEVQNDPSGEDTTRNFEEPYWDDEKSSVIIKANLNKRLDVDSVKKVTVQIPASVYYESDYTNEAGAKIKIYLGKEEARTYSVDSSTRNKAYIKFNDKGGVELFNTNNSEFNNSSAKEYSIGEIQTILCSEKQNYQLLGWINAAENAIEITQTNKNNNIYTYSFKILQACGTRESPVVLNANVKERLRVNKIEPAFNDEGVEKDRSIKIYFNHKPDLELCRQKIAVNCSGLGNVKDCFPIDDWTLADQATTDGYLLTIKASTTNRIHITAISTVTVSFDANFYYADGSSLIYYGGEGYSYDYKIKNETLTKAVIDFAVTEEAGAAQGTITNGTDGEYSIGTKIKTTFEASEDYEFLYWTVTPAGALVFDDPENDKFLASTYLTVAQAGEVTVKPVCAPKIKILSFQPSDAENAANPCDSDIKLEVNKLPEPFRTKGAVAANSNNPTCISILYNGNNVLGANYKNPELITENGKYYIKLQNTQKLYVPENTTKNVNINIDGTLFYNYTDNVITEPIRIYIANSGYSNSFNVNAETTNKVYVRFDITKDTDTNTDTVILDASTISALEHYKAQNYSSTNKLYIFNENTEFYFDYSLAENYVLTLWKTNLPKGAVNNTAIINTNDKTLTIGKAVNVGAANENGTEANPFVLETQVQLLPAVVSVTPELETIDYRTQIVFEFNQELYNSLYNKVTIKTTSGLVLTNNYTREVEDNKIILNPVTTGTNTLLSRFSGSDSMDIIIELDKSISAYGTGTNGQNGQTMTDNYTKSYRLSKAPETDSPQFVEFRIAKTSEEARNENGIYVDPNFKLSLDKGQDKVIENNLSIVNQMYIYFTATDNPEKPYQSGVDKLIVIEVQTHDQENIELSNPIMTEYEIVPEYTDLDNGVKEALVPLKLKSGNGKVNVSFSIKDKNGNESSPKVYQLLNDQYDYSDVYFKSTSPSQNYISDGIKDGKPYDVVDDIYIKFDDIVLRSYIDQYQSQTLKSYYFCSIPIKSSSTADFEGTLEYLKISNPYGYTKFGKAKSPVDIFREDCTQDTIITVTFLNWAGKYDVDLVIPKSVNTFPEDKPLQISKFSDDSGATLFVNKPVGFQREQHGDGYIDYKLAYKTNANNSLTITDFPYSTSTPLTYDFYILPYYTTDIMQIDGSALYGCVAENLKYTYQFTGGSAASSSITVPDISDVIIDSVVDGIAHGHIVFANGVDSTGCGVYANGKAVSSNCYFEIEANDEYTFKAYKMDNETHQIVLSDGEKTKNVYDNYIKIRAKLKKPQQTNDNIKTGYIFEFKELKIQNVDILGQGSDSVTSPVFTDDYIQGIVCYYMNADPGEFKGKEDLIRNIVLNEGTRIYKDKSIIYQGKGGALWFYLNFPHHKKSVYCVFGFVDKDGKEWYMKKDPNESDKSIKGGYVCIDNLSRNSIGLEVDDVFIKTGVNYQIKFTANANAYATYFDTTSGYWKLNSNTTGTTNGKFTFSGTPYTGMNTFVKVNAHGNTDSLYVFDTYLLNPQACQYNIRDVVQGLYTTTILIDKPVLLQTYCSKNNYGDSIEDWDCYGWESEVYMKDSTFSIQPDLSIIPEDWYYVNVVRFIDGTTYITDVKQK